MRTTLVAAGLPFPPIPESLLPRVEKMADWEWGTAGTDPAALYNFRGHAQLVLVEASQDSMALSNAGHGVNSYGLQYQLAYRWIAVFAQVGWGGAYMDDTTQARKIGGVFGAVTRLLAVFDRISWSPPAGWRLVVADSELEQSRLAGWLNQTSATDERIDAWWTCHSRDDGDPFAVTGEWLESLDTGDGRELRDEAG